GGLHGSLEVGGRSFVSRGQAGRKQLDVATADPDARRLTHGLPFGRDVPRRSPTSPSPVLCHSAALSPPRIAAVTPARTVVAARYSSEERQIDGSRAWTGHLQPPRRPRRGCDRPHRAPNPAR